MADPDDWLADAGRGHHLIAGAQRFHRHPAAIGHDPRAGAEAGRRGLGRFDNVGAATAIRFEQEQLSRIAGIEVQLQCAAAVAHVRNCQHSAAVSFRARRLRYQIGDVDRVAVVDTGDLVVGGIGGGEPQDRGGARAEGDRTGSGRPSCAEHERAGGQREATDKGVSGGQFDRAGAVDEKRTGAGITPRAAGAGLIGDDAGDGGDGAGSGPQRDGLGALQEDAVAEGTPLLA